MLHIRRPDGSDDHAVFMLTEGADFGVINNSPPLAWKIFAIAAVTSR